MRKKLGITLLVLALVLQATPAMAFETIKKGDQSTRVQVVQMRLNELGYSVGTVDGAFGGKSEQAVMGFQQDHGLEATGEVDEATWNALYDESVTISTDGVSVEVMLTAPFSKISKSDEKAVLDVNGVECEVYIETDSFLEQMKSQTERFFKEDFETNAAVQYQGSNEDSYTMDFALEDKTAFLYSQTFDYVYEGQELTMHTFRGGMELEEVDFMTPVVMARVDFSSSRGAEVILTQTDMIELLGRIRTGDGADETAAETGEEDGGSAAAPADTQDAGDELPEYQTVENITSLTELMDPIMQYVDPEADGSNGFDGPTCVNMYYGAQIMKWYRTYLEAGDMNDIAATANNVLKEAQMEIIVHAMDQEARAQYPVMRDKFAAALTAARLAVEESAAPYLEKMGITEVNWMAKEVDLMEKAVIENGFDHVAEVFG